MVYLIDEQALRSNLVRLVYINIHGQAVWHNTVLPDEIQFFEATYFRGGTLSRLSERAFDSEDSLLEPGAHISYESY